MNVKRQTKIWRHNFLWKEKQ